MPKKVRCRDCLVHVLESRRLRQGCQQSLGWPGTSLAEGAGSAVLLINLSITRRSGRLPAEADSGTVQPEACVAASA